MHLATVKLVTLAGIIRLDLMFFRVMALAVILKKGTSKNIWTLTFENHILDP